MQETAKVNYVQYGRSTKLKKKKPQSSAGVTGQGAGSHKGAGGHRGSSGKSHKWPPLPPDTCYRCGKGKHRKAQDCKAVDATCRGCGKKGHYEKVCLQGKHSAHSLETPQMTSAGAGASEPLYFNDEGQPVYTYMVSVPHANKHLIRFPIRNRTYVTEKEGHTGGFFSIYTFCIAQGRYRSRCQPNQQERLSINSLTAKCWSLHPSGWRTMEIQQ